MTVGECPGRYYIGQEKTERVPGEDGSTARLMILFIGNDSFVHGASCVGDVSHFPVLCSLSRGIHNCNSTTHPAPQKEEFPELSSQLNS